MALAALWYIRRRRQRVGLSHKLSDVTSLDSPVGLPPMEGEIDPAEFVICRDAKGDEVCLGQGNFGKARCVTSRRLNSLGMLRIS